MDPKARADIWTSETFGLVLLKPAAMTTSLMFSVGTLARLCDEQKYGQVLVISFISHHERDGY